MIASLPPDTRRLVAALIKGMRVEEAIARLDGIDCRGRGTSCPDQLARALREYLAKQ